MEKSNIQKNDTRENDTRENDMQESDMRENDTQEMIQRAYRDFDEFFTATRQYRERCAANEAFWRGDHWRGYGAREADAPEPVTPVLFSTLESVLADMMDNYPEAVLIGEEPGDDALAGELTQIVRFILKRRGYRETFRRKCRGALKKGASALQVFWNDALLDGMGDVDIRELDIRSLLWDPAFEDIQDGRACIQHSFYPREWFGRHYPKALDEMKGDGYRRERFGGETPLDGGAEDILLMDYWFREPDEEGVTRVHMLRIAGGALLEDSRRTRPQGMYAHGRYPFIVEALYPIEGQPVGFGLIDALKNMQMYADRMDQIILKNIQMSASPKMMISRSADIDEEALTDWSREVVRAGRIDENAVRWFQAAPLNPYAMAHHRGKLDAIKEQSGQNQFNRGETMGGVTAASAIVALQEAGNKRSRMLIEQMNDGFERMVRMIVELVAENYTEPRRVRVRGEGTDNMLQFDGSAWGERGPLDFDISVNVQKQTPQRTLYQNELALQLLQAGVIEREDALGMMTFPGKDAVMARAARGAPQREMER